MRVVRLAYEDRCLYGTLEGDEVRVLSGLPSPEPEFTGEVVPLTKGRLLAPCEPTKIIALGLNYRDHARELGMKLPEEPLLFLKPPSAVIGPEEKIILPPQSQRVDYEAELAVVIGRRAKDVSPEKALDYVLGYTCFNDVTARDLQQKDGQWTRAKGFDTFAPFGPWIETDLDPSDLRVEAYLNGKRCQSSSTRELVFPVPEIVSYVSRVMTLLPGDVIATGTPPGIGPLKPGDVIEIRVEGIGTLRNYVHKLAY
jgi:2-keto-4-pentenoate hydratase/2-oxohepta-3-ene-1,7-dioic acid hydratase in catechol pathway